MNFRKFRSRSREEFLPSKSLQCSGPTPPSLERPAQEKPSYTVKMRIDPYERKGRASGAGERRPAKGGWRLEKRGRSVRGTARREENLPPRRNGKRTYDDPVNLPRRSFAGESRGSKNTDGTTDLRQPCRSTQEEWTGNPSSRFVDQASLRRFNNRLVAGGAAEAARSRSSDLKRASGLHSPESTRIGCRFVDGRP